MARLSWQVTGQVTDQVASNNAGRTITGVIVYFVTGEGNEGSIFVPNNLYSKDYVHKHVHEAAAKLDEVGNLVEGQIQAGL